jgi:SET domain-containing protein
VEKIIAGLKMSAQNEKKLKVIIPGDNQRGVRAKCRFTKGDFICEYPDKVVTFQEADRREAEYKLNDEGCFILKISATMAMDATREYHRLGRLVNHAAKNANAKLHPPLTIEGKTRVPFVATKDIAPGEGIFFDYGIR